MIDAAKHGIGPRPGADNRGRGHQIDVRGSKFGFDQFDAAMAGNGLRIGPLVAVRTWGYEIHGGKIGARAGQRRGDDRGIETARELQHDVRAGAAPRPRGSNESCFELGRELGNTGRSDFADMFPWRPKHVRSRLIAVP